MSIELSLVFKVLDFVSFLRDAKHSHLIVKLKIEVERVKKTRILYE